MKRYIQVRETKNKHDAESIKRLAHIGLKPSKTTAWMFLVDKKPEIYGQLSTAVLIVDSPKHARRIYDMLTRVTLLKYADDPTIGMFTYMSGRTLAKIVVDVIKAMNIPKNECKITRIKPLSKPQK